MAGMERRSGRAARGLSLAAAPAFAAMAWISAIGTPPIPLCSASAALPIDAMAWMYALMCLFHLPPWLNRTARRAHPHALDRGERQ
ncbi:hypothetical protein K7G82_23725 [Sphingomonas colocasiae]|uniref:Uncharacterized protein n=2 Tax=Sphingomonas colocasiae TaxID=1848973 RepID=A0ABS7PWK5_9SPHN|nr:hypothetical protein [Sphingomonas colocasiae]